VCEREIEEGFLTAFGMTWMDWRSFLSKKTINQSEGGFSVLVHLLHPIQRRTT
jgi:hypothetical protein